MLDPLLLAIAIAGALVVVAVVPVLRRRRRAGPAGAALRGRLEVQTGPLAGQVIALEGPETTIGSVAGNHILLADPAVSRRHARLKIDKSRYVVEDLGSTNGVYVNRRRRRRRALEGGDLLRIGNSEMVFQLDGPA